MDRSIVTDSKVFVDRNLLKIYYDLFSGMRQLDKILNDIIINEDFFDAAIDIVLNDNSNNHIKKTEEMPTKCKEIIEKYKNAFLVIPEEGLSMDDLYKTFTNYGNKNSLSTLRKNVGELKKHGDLKELGRAKTSNYRFNPDVLT